MNKEHQTTAVAALLASGLFLLVGGLDLGVLFLFLCTLPLFGAGFGAHPRVALQASAIAALLIAIVTGISDSVFFLLMFALPCSYICRMAMHSRTLALGDSANTHWRLWFPIGVALTHIAVYACALLALVAAYYSSQGTPLPSLLARILADQMQDFSKLHDIKLDIPSDQLYPLLHSSLFMMFGGLTWFCITTLWLHGWLANRAMAKRKATQRPNLSITPFPMPNWLLSLMGICALASLIGGETMQFLGRSCLMILLLPYIFQGAALMHFTSMSWPNRRFFLFFIYFLIALQLWPVLILSGIGLWYHLKTLNKHLSAGGTSSR